MSFRVLALESSCDEFAGAVIEDGIEVLASVVASQAEIHARYGGVVPEVAGREHLRNLAPVMQATLESAGLDWDDLDAIAVTQGPGLGGSLLVGVNAAKAAAWARGLPLIPVHHIAGHLYANWLRPARDEWDDAPPPFPLVALVVSGGHTELFWMQDPERVERIGQTRADAAGCWACPFPADPKSSGPPGEPHRSASPRSIRCPAPGCPARTISPSPVSRPRCSTAFVEPRLPGKRSTCPRWPRGSRSQSPMCWQRRPPSPPSRLAPPASSWPAASLPTARCGKPCVVAAPCRSECPRPGSAPTTPP